MVVLYLCVRIRAGGDVVPRLGRGHPPAANPTPFLTISKKAEGGAGEAAKKLKGTGVGLLRLTIFRKVFIKPLSGVKA